MSSFLISNKNGNSFNARMISVRCCQGRESGRKVFGEVRTTHLTEIRPGKETKNKNEVK